MTGQDASRLGIGLYRLYIIDSTQFMLASVGQYHDVPSWYCPCNWINGMPSTNWALVDRAELIMRPWTPEEGKCNTNRD